MGPLLWRRPAPPPLAPGEFLWHVPDYRQYDRDTPDSNSLKGPQETDQRCKFLVPSFIQRQTDLQPRSARRQTKNRRLVSITSSLLSLATRSRWITSTPLPRRKLKVSGFCPETSGSSSVTVSPVL